MRRIEPGRHLPKLPSSFPLHIDSNFEKCPTPIYLEMIARPRLPHRWRGIQQHESEAREMPTGVPRHIVTLGRAKSQSDTWHPRIRLRTVANRRSRTHIWTRDTMNIFCRWRGHTAGVVRDPGVARRPAVRARNDRWFRRRLPTASTLPETQLYERRTPWDDDFSPQ